LYPIFCSFLVLPIFDCESFQGVESVEGSWAVTKNFNHARYCPTHSKPAPIASGQLAFFSPLIIFVIGDGFIKVLTKITNGHFRIRVLAYQSLQNLGRELTAYGIIAKGTAM